MKPEQLVWQALKRAAKINDMMLQRIENGVLDGMPDVFGINKNGAVFFIENKALANLPVRENTLVLKRYVRPQQINWHRNYARYGGKSYFLVKVNRQFFMFSGLTVVHYIDTMNKTLFEQLPLCGHKITDAIEYLKELTP